MEQQPCPRRILWDTGGAFAMGCVGGAIWHGVKGFRNDPNRWRGMINSARFKAPQTANGFGAWGLVFSSCDCSLVAIRRTEDSLNPIIAGGVSGGILGIRNGKSGMITGAIGGTLILALIEGASFFMTRYMGAMGPAPPPEEAMPQPHQQMPPHHPVAPPHVKDGLYSTTNSNQYGDEIMRDKYEEDASINYLDPNQKLDAVPPSQEKKSTGLWGRIWR